MHTTKRIYGLDILRAIAILTVIYSHAGIIIGSYINPQIYNSIVVDGVSVFFVLSGFLIGNILLKTINHTSFEIKDLLNFWVRRWFRTVPTYFIILFLIILYDYHIHQIKTFPVNYFLFLQTIKYGSASIYPESWSLCVEEWFYLSVPFLFLVSFKLIKYPRNYIVLFWICFFILVPCLLRVYKETKIHSDADWEFLIRKVVFTRLDAIMFGFLGAYIYYYNPTKWIKYKNSGFLLGIIIFISIDIYACLKGFTLILHYVLLPAESVATLLILPKLTTIKSGAGAVYKAFTFISKISYPMYLINLTPFFSVFYPRLNRIIPKGDFVSYDLIRMICFLSFSIVGAYFIHIWFELPFINLREKFSKKDN